MDKQYLLTLAAYHAWANEILQTALREVSDSAYKKDTGLFFSSIHGTLNHQLLAERIWMARLCATDFAFDGLDMEIESERNALREALDAQAAAWHAWIRDHDIDALRASFTYSNSAGDTFQNRVHLVLAHVFNHATHHRGQVSAAMTTLGHPAPVLDLIYYLRDR